MPWMTPSLASAISPASRSRSAQSAHTLRALPPTLTDTSLVTSSLHSRQIGMREILLATAGGCTNIQLGVERRGDQLDVAQPGLGDGVEHIEQLDDAALAAPVRGLGHGADARQALDRVGAKPGDRRGPRSLDRGRARGEIGRAS